MCGDGWPWRGAFRAYLAWEASCGSGAIRESGVSLARGSHRRSSRMHLPAGAKIREGHQSGRQRPIADNLGNPGNEDHRFLRGNRSASRYGAALRIRSAGAARVVSTCPGDERVEMLIRTMRMHCWRLAASHRGDLRQHAHSGDRAEHAQAAAKRKDARYADFLEEVLRAECGPMRGVCGRARC
jgi:hypothetical protein